MTTLTDMKNSTASKSSKKTVAWQKRKICNTNLRDRSELEKNYGARILYADLMLKVGHTCTKYNYKSKASNNYIYKSLNNRVGKSPENQLDTGDEIVARGELLRSQLKML